MNSAQLKNSLSRLGLSQVGLARVIGADDRTIRRYLKGDRAIPDTVALIIAAFEQNYLSEPRVKNLHAMMKLWEEEGATP